jgi:putative transposase
MKGSRFSDEEIIRILRQGRHGRDLAALCLQHGISRQTYYRWRMKYAGPRAAVPLRKQPGSHATVRLVKQAAELMAQRDALRTGRPKP